MPEPPASASPSGGPRQRQHHGEGHRQALPPHVIVRAKDETERRALSGAGVSVARPDDRAALDDPLARDLHEGFARHCTRGRTTCHGGRLDAEFPGQEQGRRRHDLRAPDQVKSLGVVATLGADRSLGRARCFPRRAWIADSATVRRLCDPHQGSKAGDHRPPWPTQSRHGLARGADRAPDAHASTSSRSTCARIRRTTTRAAACSSSSDGAAGS